MKLSLESEGSRSRTILLSDLPESELKLSTLCLLSFSVIKSPLLTLPATDLKEFRSGDLVLESAEEGPLDRYETLTSTESFRAVAFELREEVDWEEGWCDEEEKFPRACERRSL